jgi:hypothetical protein
MQNYFGMAYRCNKRLTTHEISALQALQWFADTGMSENGRVKVAIGDVAKAMHCTAITARNALNRLEERGAVCIHRSGGYFSHQYEINMGWFHD